MGCCFSSIIPFILLSPHGSFITHWHHKHDFLTTIFLSVFNVVFCHWQTNFFQIEKLGEWCGKAGSVLREDGWWSGARRASWQSWSMESRGEHFSTPSSGGISWFICPDCKCYYCWPSRSTWWCEQHNMWIVVSSNQSVLDWVRFCSSPVELPFIS